MPQARGIFFCFNQNRWSYSIASFQLLPLFRRIVAGDLPLNQGTPYFRYSSKNAFSFPNGMM
ncbi:hypothetical protein ABG982_02020, partial [Collinsella aerofaciens]